MHFLLYLFLIGTLLWIGSRALLGKGLALTLFKSYKGPYAKILGALCLVMGFLLLGLILSRPELPALLLGQ